MQRLKLILLLIRFCALKTLVKRVLPVSSCICVICERAVMQIRSRIVLHHTHGACYTLINDARINLSRELFWPRKQTSSMRTFIAILRPPRTLLIFFHHGIDRRDVLVAILPIQLIARAGVTALHALKARLTSRHTFLQAKVGEETLILRCGVPSELISCQILIRLQHWLLA